MIISPLETSVYVQWNLRVMDTVGTNIFPLFGGCPLSEVEMYGQLMAGGKQFVPCREVVLLLECPCIIGGFTVIIFWLYMHF